MTTYTDTKQMTYWEPTAEAAEASIAKKLDFLGGTLATRDITPTDTNFRVDLTYTVPAAFRGKTGYVEHVVDVPQDSGEENYNVWTDDGHVGGSFDSAADARRWAAKEGVAVRAGIVKRRAADDGFPVPGRRGAIEAGQHLGGQP